MKSLDHELDWLAFRYVAGELAVDEAAAFEQRLAEDQAARDAVAGAVDLSQTILAAESLVSATTVESAAFVQRGWTSHAAWFALGATACLLLLLVLNFAGRPERGSSVSAELADAWSQRLESTVEPEALLDLSDSESPEPNEPDDEPIMTAEAPAWMVEAVHSLHSGEPDGPDSAPTQEVES